MTKKRGSDFELGRALLDPSFYPRAADAGPLLELLLPGVDPADAAERALLRLGILAAPAAIERAAAAEPSDRVTLRELLGGLGTETPDPAICTALLAGLGDADERVRRAAAAAIGRARPGGAEAAITAALPTEAGDSARRAMIEAL